MILVKAIRKVKKVFIYKYFDAEKICECCGKDVNVKTYRVIIKVINLKPLVFVGNILENIE